MNYEELVKALRVHASVDIECYECAYYDDCCINGNGHTKMMTDAAAAIEALQAQLPKQGEWIWIQKANGGQYKGCSVCHAPIPTDSMLDYLDDEDCYFCYSCGAKMEVQE